MLTNQITLHATHASGSLTPSVLTTVFARMNAKAPAAAAPHGTMFGQVLRLADGLELDDAACATFQLEFALQGSRVHGGARGPSAALLTWAFHALAAELRCRLEVDEDETEPDPGAALEAAMVYLATYERAVHEDREGMVASGDDAAAAFLAWLANEEHLELVSDEEKVDALAALLPMADASAMYEALLESDAVEEVFASESELSTLVERFRARVVAEVP